MFASEKEARGQRVRSVDKDTLKRICRKNLTMFYKEGGARP